MKCWKNSAGRDSLIKLIFRVLSFSVTAGMLLGSVLLAPILRAQISQDQIPRDQISQAQDEPTFRSQTNVVMVPALVRDASGHAVYGLQAKDFILEDNGVVQTIHLDEDADAEPLSIVVAVQAGRSAQREFPRIRGLNSMLGPILEEPETEIAIVEFDSQVRLAQGFTSDDTTIGQTLKNLQAGDGGDAILDVVRYSAELLNKLSEPRQRVLLLVSETRDHGSRGTKIDDVVALLGNSNISVYALAFSPGLGDVIDPYRDGNSDQMESGGFIPLLLLTRAAMKRNTPKAIASQSGGEYEMFDTLNGFENHMLDFTNHLHSRYLVSFQAKDPQPGLHQIRVRLAEPGDARVLARESYWAFAGPDREDSESPFAGRWQTKISPVTEKHSATLNISLSEGIAGGTVVLVNPDGTEITSPILNPGLNGETLTFDTTFGNGTTFSWHLSLKKDGKEGMLHGSVGERAIEEPVFKQP